MIKTFHLGIADEGSLASLLRAGFGAEVAEELPVADLPAGEVAAALPRQLGVDVPEEGFGRVPTQEDIVAALEAWGQMQSARGRRVRLGPYEASGSAWRGGATLLDRSGTQGLAVVFYLGIPGAGSCECDAQDPLPMLQVLRLLTERTGALLVMAKGGGRRFVIHPASELEALAEQNEWERGCHH